MPERCWWLFTAGLWGAWGSSRGRDGFRKRKWIKKGRTGIALNGIALGVTALKQGMPGRSAPSGGRAAWQRSAWERPWLAIRQRPDGESPVCTSKGRPSAWGEGPASGPANATASARPNVPIFGAVRPERETYRSVSPRRIAPTLAAPHCPRARPPANPQRAHQESSSDSITVAATGDGDQLPQCAQAAETHRLDAPQDGDSHQAWDSPGIQQRPPRTELIKLGSKHQPARTGRCW